MEDKAPYHTNHINPQPPLIYSALVNVIRKVEAIGKNRKNQEQNYKFRGIDDAYNELHNLFAENGIIILPKIIDSSREDRKTTSGKNLIHSVATYEFSFVASDGSREKITLQGEGMDTGDKSLNKAFSAALKYALMSMFLIPTEEDKDPESAHYEVKAAEKPKPPLEEDRFTNLIGQLKNAPTRGIAESLIIKARTRFTLSERQGSIIQEWEDNLNKP